MSGFDAGRDVEVLAYDFTTGHDADGNPLVGKGTVPEPSQERLDNFFKALRGAVTDSGIELSDDPQAIAKALADAGEEAVESVFHVTRDALVDLCNGSPSREEILALPPRIRNAFYGWLIGELTDPTGSQPATRPTRAA